MCYTASANGHLAVWECNLEPGELKEGRFRPNKKKKKGKEKKDEDESEDDLPKEEVDEMEAEEEEEDGKFFYKRSARHFLRDNLPQVQHLLFVLCNVFVKNQSFIAGRPPSRADLRGLQPPSQDPDGRLLVRRLLRVRDARVRASPLSLSVRPLHRGDSDQPGGRGRLDRARVSGKVPILID